MRGGHNFIDITGKKFARLTVVKRAENKNNRAHWECLCDCGNISVVSGKCLRSGRIRSCGCLQVEFAKENGKLNRTHGLSLTRIYSIWSSMFGRCYRPSSDSYERYGARGITVCDKWHKFEGFLEDMQESYADDLTIDRIDNDKGYSKDNCKWSNVYEQARNKRNTKYVEYRGKREKLIELRERFGVTKSQFRGRRIMGYTVEEALTKGGK